jgi:ABC-2 type transport system permease protein
MIKYAKIAKNSLQTAMQYNISFFANSFFFILIIYIFVCLWKTVYGNGNSTLISGFSLNRLLWYLIVTELIVSSLVSIFDTLGNDIKTGMISSYLIRPVNYILFSFCQNVGATVFKLTINIGFAILLGFYFAGPLEGFSIYHIHFMLISLILGVVLQFFLFTLFGLSAMWMEENTSIYFLVQKFVFIFGMFMPIEFFPQWFQKISTFLPFPYITCYTAKVIVDFSYGQFFETIFYQSLWIIILVILTLFVYKRGVRKINVNGG